MKNHQTERYQQLLRYLEANLKKPISSTEIEQITFYSYRNMNRIFEALHGETIGKYIKRLRLEKAAEYLVYTQDLISDIADELNFNDIATFSKAFRKRFGSSPTEFRNQKEKLVIPKSSSQKIQPEITEPIQFELQQLPTFQYLFFEYRGDYANLAAIKRTWDQLLDFCEQQQIADDKSMFFGAILDNNEITEAIHCRYRAAVIINARVANAIKYFATHPTQWYAKFTHHGSDELIAEVYQRIYAQWMTTVQKEFADLPTLEFYPSDKVTEIYIPIK